MKRLWTFVAVLLIALLGFVLLRSLHPGAPRFKAIHFTAGMVGTNALGYDFLAPAPFEGGKMWVGFWDGTNTGIFLFDIERREVLGEIVNGGPLPVFLDGRNSKLVCLQLGGTPKSLKEMFLRTLRRLTRPKPQGQALLMEPQSCWLLDLQNNKAIQFGELPQYPNSTFIPSPDRHYGYSVTGGGPRMDQTFCFDLKAQTVRSLPPVGYPYGWWGSTTILALSTNNDFQTYDVQTRKCAPFLSSKQISSFFKENSISDDPAKARTFSVWNGQEDDFYLTDIQQKCNAEESYLIKLDRPAVKLKLISRRFKFEWSDSIDGSGRYYLYSGREPGQASNGVFLRDLEDGTSRTLVEPTSEKYFSIPRFYANSVIYIRSNALWRITLDGKQNVRLFPPQESSEIPPSK